MIPLRIDESLPFVEVDGDGTSTTSSSLADPRGLVLNAALGSLVFAGGLMGFIKAGSKASLIAGSMFGSLMMVSSWFISKKQQVGNAVGGIVSTMLTYIMGKKYRKSGGKFIPSGLIASMSIITITYNAISIYLQTTNKSNQMEFEKEEDNVIVDEPLTTTTDSDEDDENEEDAVVGGDENGDDSITE